MKSVLKLVLPSVLLFSILAGLGMLLAGQWLNKPVQNRVAPEVSTSQPLQLHHQVAADNSAVITLTGLSNPEEPNIQGEIVSDRKALLEVEVVYTSDAGQTWQSLAATPSPAERGTWAALLLSQPVGTTVHYYLRTRDSFNHRAAFPPASETWTTDGVSQGVNLEQALAYAITSPPRLDEPEASSGLVIGLSGLLPLVGLGLVWLWQEKRYKRPHPRF